MKLSTCYLFSLSLLVISFSLANGSPNLDELIKCVESNCKGPVPISDAIIASTNPSFQTTLEDYIRNLRFLTSKKPLAIVAAKHESHVQATVTCCKQLGLQMRIRSGGHDYDGLSYVSEVPFIILDTFNLRKIKIDIASETASIQAGVNLGELYYAIANKSNVHAFPAGICPTLGVGGHFSGGGYGNMMRKYGLSIDNVIDAQIVNAKGEILDRKSMGEDLFWAIRGGGGASFGVILSWKIKLVSVPEKVTVFRVDKSTEEGATDLVAKWQEIAADKLDKDLYIRAMVMPAKKTVKASFVGMFLGDIKRLLPLMKSSFPELGLTEKNCTEMRWIESTLYWVGIPNGVPIEALLNRTSKAAVTYLVRKSDYVQTPIPKSELEKIWKVMIENGEVGMAWNPYGGKMSEIPESETAFPHRAGNLYKIQYSSNWKETDEATAKKNIDLTRSLYEAMTPYVSKNPREAFLNYRDIDLGSIGSNGDGSMEEANAYGHSYFKGNFEKLVAVKAKVDPDNFFRYEQSIPVQIIKSSGTSKCKATGKNDMCKAT